MSEFPRSGYEEDSDSELLGTPAGHGEVFAAEQPVLEQERDVDGYVDANGQRAPHQSPAEVAAVDDRSQELESHMHESPASGETLADVRDIYD